MTTQETTRQTYDRLANMLRDTAALGGISGLLGWDEMVMMPPGAAASRSRQKAALGPGGHRRLVREVACHTHTALGHTLLHTFQR